MVALRTGVKRGLMRGFCAGFIPSFFVTAAFRLLRLRSL
jgi:hypothetical protein